VPDLFLAGAGVGRGDHVDAGYYGLGTQKEVPRERSAESIEIMGKYSIFEETAGTGLVKHRVTNGVELFQREGSGKGEDELRAKEVAAGGRLAEHRVTNNFELFQGKWCGKGEDQLRTEKIAIVR
jgi:hypothetical protein